MTAVIVSPKYQVVIPKILYKIKSHITKALSTLPTVAGHQKAAPLMPALNRPLALCSLSLITTD